MKRYFLLLTVLFFALFFEAKEVSYNEALTKASEFFAPASSSKKQIKALQNRLSLATTFNQTEEKNKPAFYIINNGENGFVIVSADDNTKSILGYSDKGSFDVNNIPENVKFWLNHYAHEISDIAKNGISEPLYATTTYTPVAPLLGNIEHDQDTPYNNECPLRSGNQRTVTGCVATAAAQIMTKWKYPAKGKGTVTYTAQKLNRSLSANLNQSTYDWSNILNKYTSGYSGTQANAVALLLRDVGYAAHMDYNTVAYGGSGTSDQEMAAALVNNFSYDKSLSRICFNQSSNYEKWNWQSEDEVLEELHKDLREGRPIFASGVSPSGGGHAFVCEGIQSDGKLHINWGWNGSYNGYYELTGFEPGTGGIGAGQGKYTETISFLTNIQPNKGTSEIPLSWGLEELQFVQEINEFPKADNTDAKLFETGSDNNWIYSLNYVPTFFYLGYSIYKDATSINTVYAPWIYNPFEGTILEDYFAPQQYDGKDEFDLGDARSYGNSVAPKIKISSLVSGVSIGIYDLYLSSMSSPTSKLGYPIYIKNRGKVKNKIAIGKNKVYIYPASAKNYSRTNTPTNLTVTQTGSTYTLAWSGNSSRYILLTWDNNDLQTEIISSKTKKGVSAGKSWAVIACEQSGSVVYATSNIASGPKLNSGNPSNPDTPDNPNTPDNPDTPADAEDVEADNIMITTNHLNIEVKATTQSAIKIYTISGDILYSVQGTQVSFKAPQAGIYVVQVGDKKKKVLAQ